MGHSSVLHALSALNKTAGLGMDKEIEKGRDDFMTAWSKEVG